MASATHMTADIEDNGAAGTERRYVLLVKCGGVPLLRQVHTVLGAALETAEGMGVKDGDVTWCNKPRGD